MLGIQVNGTFLQLAPGTTAQLQRNNPFLTKDKIDGEYSLPVNIDYTEANCLALGLLYSYYTPRKKTTLEAALYNGTGLAYRGKLVIEGLQGGHINNPRTGTLTGYFICGVSTFLYRVKEVLLKDLPLGTRRYNWTTDVHNDSTNGFYQHCHRTWTDPTLGYVFYPIRNDGWEGSDSQVDWQNKIELSNAGYKLSVADNKHSLCPHLYLVPLLQRLFAHYGYSIGGPVLQDFGFKQLTLVSYRSIHWWNEAANAPRTQISWALAEHVPPTWTVTDLLINLQQYFGIAFLIDPLTYTVEVVALKDTRGGTRKDWTQYAEPGFDSDFSEDQSLFALKPELDSADGLPGSRWDATGKTVLPPVPDRAHLITLGVAANLDKYVYCWADNTWYLVDRHNANPFVIGPPMWQYDFIPQAYGVHGYEPANSTDTIESRVSTLAMLTSEQQSDSTAPRHLRLHPACTQEGNWIGKTDKETTWQARLLFYRGLTAGQVMPTYNGTALQPDVPYPYATHTTQGMLLGSTPTGAWALSMEYQRPGAATGVGVKDYWWQPWLDCLQNSPELMPFTLWLPRPVLEAHRWTDVILIRHVPYLVQSFDETLPYPGYVKAQLRRIG